MRTTAAEDQRARADRLDGSEPPDAALPLLVEAYGPRIYALGLRFCGDAADAEDLVQEVFLQAFRRWDRFEGRAKPSTWLYTIAARACRRMQRKRVGEPERTLSLDELLPFGETRMAVVPGGGELQDEEGRAEAQARVERAIARLPETFRLPLVLKEIAGFQVAEVATILGLKEATVKTRLHRARLRVRKALEEALEEREVPSAAFSRRVCLDLLEAKQEALDRGAPFAFPGGVVCERCAELFATLDLTSELCHEVAQGGPLPERLRSLLLDSFRD